MFLPHNEMLAVGWFCKYLCLLMVQFCSSEINAFASGIKCKMLVFSEARGVRKVSHGVRGFQVLFSSLLYRSVSP